MPWGVKSCIKFEIIECPNGPVQNTTTTSIFALFGFRNDPRVPIRGGRVPILAQRPVHMPVALEHQEA